MKAKLAKRKSIKSRITELKDQLIELIEREGLRPYNAAIRLGIPHRQATIFATDYAVSKIFTLTPRDVLEQEGKGVRDVIKRIIRKAGLLEDDGVKGAQKVISAQVIYKPGEGIKGIKANSLTTDFVDVDDERIQLDYLKELMLLTEIKKKDDNDEDDPGKNKGKTFNIQINVFGDEPDKRAHTSPEIVINEVNNGGARER